MRDWGGGIERLSSLLQQRHRNVLAMPRCWFGWNLTGCGWVQAGSAGLVAQQPRVRRVSPSLRAAGCNARSATQGVAVIRCFSSMFPVPSRLSRLLSSIHKGWLATLPSPSSHINSHLSASPFGTRAAARFLPLRLRQSEAISAPAIRRRRPIRRALSRCRR